MHFYLYESVHDAKWRWRLIGENLEILAVGGEGYVSKQDAINSINFIKQCISNLKIFDSSTAKLV